MKKLVKNINLDTGIIGNVFDGTDNNWAILQGYSWEEVERGFDFIYYLLGFAPKQSLAEIKHSKIQEINKIYENKAVMVKFDTPSDEVLTWNIQKTEAEAFEKDNTAPTPFIDGIANARKVDRVLLISKVLEKTRAYNDYMAYLTGTRQFYEDQIKIAQNIEEVEAVQWLEKA